MLEDAPLGCGPAMAASLAAAAAAAAPRLPSRGPSEDVADVWAAMGQKGEAPPRLPVS